MGFHVTLKEDDSRLIQKLRSDPSEVFGRPYAGYLLFLIGGTDDKAVEWLKRHLVSLDSLTGDHIAFAVFASKVPVQLEVQNPEDQPYNPRNVSQFLGDIPLSEVRRIDSYIQAGKHGFVFEGDSLNAITYGTDAVARSFGVMKHLPCLLAFDAFTQTDVVVIEMDDKQLPNLFPMLRIAMGKLNEDTQFAASVQSLKLFENLKQQIADITNKIRTQQHELSILPVDTEEHVGDKINGFYLKITEALRIGSHREFRKQLTDLREYVGGVVIDDLDESTGQRVVGLGKTISALKKFEGKQWPLGDVDSSEYQRILNDHVIRLLPRVSIPTGQTRENFETVNERLLLEQAALVEEIECRLPKQSDLTATTVEAFAARRHRVEKQLISMRAKLRRLAKKAKSQLEWCTSEESPSLAKIIKRESQKHKIRLLAGSGAAYASKLLDPQKILKIISAAIGFGI